MSEKFENMLKAALEDAYHIGESWRGDITKLGKPIIEYVNALEAEVAELRTRAESAEAINAWLAISGNALRADKAEAMVARLIALWQIPDDTNRYADAPVWLDEFNTLVAEWKASQNKPE